MEWSAFKALIIDNLSDDLLDKNHRKVKQKSINLPNTYGHCYVASEAAYHMLGGKDEGWTPCFIRHLGQAHWFLKHKSGSILDLTANQFETPIIYSEGRGTGFLTKNPSKRAKKLLLKIDLTKKISKLK